MIKPDSPGHAEVTRRLGEIGQLEQALTAAGRRAIAEHLRAGRKVPVWVDGAVAWIDSLPDEPCDSQADAKATP